MAHLHRSSSINGFGDMMIRLFQQTIPGDISLLKQAIGQQKNDQVQLILHRLKPTAKVYGLFELHDLIAVSEESIRLHGLSEKNRSSVYNIIQQFQDVLSVLTEETK
jgi:HPt (histidine-containing phosphotransfer) domain-containing protein